METAHQPALQVDNVRVAALKPLITPDELKAEYPVSETAAETVFQSRETIRNILTGEDNRFLVIAGPCSIHDVDLAYDYARRLKALAADLDDRIFIVMRTYFEKPRTTVGWKGLISDPHLDGSNDLQTGLRKAREVLLTITDLGMPTATEMLDPIVAQYIADLVSWASIGARTTESQTHREMASGLSMPVGFKNSTDGNLQVAINALLSAKFPHHFLGIDRNGKTCIVETRGNEAGHIILRGGSNGPNYDSVHVASAEEQLRKAGLAPRLVIDCSHANSNKQYELQEKVLRDIIRQRLDETTAIVGAMLESNINAGRQDVPADGSPLNYGVSITDPCIDWETTERALRYAHARLSGH
jgi:3-deoxy-7-phosphoheptulonate synthase